MRHFSKFLTIALLVISTFTTAFGQMRYKPKYLRENDTTFRAFASYLSETGFIRFDAEKRPIDPDTFFETYGSAIGLGKHYAMKPIKGKTDEKGVRRQQYQLFYKNTRVEDCDFSLHSVGKRLLIVDGSMAENIEFDVDKPMPESKALDFALADQKLNAANFKGADKLPKGELVIANVGGEVVKSSYQFCYAFDLNLTPTELSAGSTRHPFRLYVDATSGKIVRRLSLRFTCALGHNTHPGVPHRHHENLPNPPVLSISVPKMEESSFTPIFPNRYGYAQTFQTETTGGNVYRLTYGSLETKRFTISADDPEPVTNTGINWGYNRRDATTAHWLMQKIHLFFNEAPFMRNGFDGLGNYPKVFVNLGGPNPVAADVRTYWQNGIMYFGRAPLPSQTMNDVTADPNTPFMSADIATHEFMHGVTDALVPNRLTYFGEPGAIHESLSDIVGTAFERWLLPEDWNWNCGEDAFLLRSMSNPSQQFPPLQPGQPTTYLTDPAWHNTSDSDDFGGVHTNSGVMNKWFHTLCTGQGPSTTTITPISFDDAFKILHGVFKNNLIRSNTNYPHMRDITVESARIEFPQNGGCSPQVQAVIAAWATAGLPMTNCNVPCTLPTNTCYKIKVVSTDKRLQATADGKVQQLPGNNQSNQLWKVTDRGSGRVSFTVQDGSERAIGAANGANYGEELGLTSYSGNGQQDWAIQCYPVNQSYWRIHNGNNNNTWDLRGWGNEPQLQIWGNTSENFVGFRMFSFEPATCPLPPTTCSLPANACYTIKVESSNKRLQATSDNKIHQLPANGINSQIWKVTNRGNGRISLTVQDGSNRAIRTNGDAAFGEELTLSGYVPDGKQDWTVGCHPTDSNLWRVFYPSNNHTWDLRNWGQDPQLQIWGNTSENFVSFRSFRFENATCPSGRKAATEPTQPDDTMNLRITPNPNTGRFLVQFQTKQGQSATLSILDEIGRSVRPSQTVMGTGQSYSQLITLPTHVHGVLFLRVNSGAEQSSLKFIVE
jgi:Zn-dependent metalloprotease